MGGIAIVAGGGSDIGTAIAARLRRDGNQVIFIDDRGAGDRPFDEDEAGYAADLSDPEALRRCIASIRERHGVIGCLIQVAPGAAPRAFLESTIDDFDRVIADNLTAAFALSQAVAREMEAAGGGAIVLVADSSAVTPREGSAILAASQAALVQLVRIMAVDLSVAKIRVNAVVAPIELQGSLGETGAAHEGAAADSTDIAAAAIFLASAESSYINGHIIEATLGPRDRSAPDPCWVSGHGQVSRSSLGHC